MYVCICRAVTDHDIREAADNGARSVGDLRRCLGVASGCGLCAVQARHILESHRDARDDADGVRPALIPLTA